MVGWHHWLDGCEFEQASGGSEGTGKPVVPQSMGSQRVRHGWVTELNWTDQGLSLTRATLVKAPSLLTTGPPGNSPSQDTEYGSLCYTVRPCCLWNLLCWQRGLAMTNGMIHLYSEKDLRWDFLVVQWLWLWTPDAGSPGQGTRSHKPQLEIHLATRKIKNPACCN